MASTRRTSCFAWVHVLLGTAMWYGHFLLLIGDVPVHNMRTGKLCFDRMNYLCHERCGSLQGHCPDYGGIEDRLGLLVFSVKHEYKK
jgi:hypothetical protein